MQTVSPTDTLSQLWTVLGQSANVLSCATLTGTEPALPSSFAVGTLAQSTIAAATLAVTQVDTLRGGRQQTVSVDMCHAALEFRSERYFRVDGQLPPEPWDKIAGLYRCGNSRWVHLRTNLPHHRDDVLKLLGCTYDRDAVAAALNQWEAEAFGKTTAQAGMVVTAARTFEEWDAHPQGTTVAGQPLMTVEYIGDAPPQPLAAHADGRPLSGVRVLDLIRVIAGPVCGRMLAAHGADVLPITAPRLPAIPSLVIDTGHGKHSAQLDLYDATEAAQLHTLLRDVNIFVQRYRPDGAAALQFGPEQAVALRPGIVYASLCTYDYEGPWANRRGFNSLVQAVSGFNQAETQAAGEAKPRLLPAQALNHGAGYPMTAGVMTALARRMTEGGSWHMRVSLAQMAHWLRSFGRIAHGFDAADSRYEGIGAYLDTAPPGFGALTTLRHAGQLSGTPLHRTLPSVPLGTHPARWQHSRLPFSLSAPDTPGVHGPSMLSYRHAFHAGNHVDVLKHVMLVQMLDYLTQKDKPFWCIDTHAGAGLYALDYEWAQKEVEFDTGIGPLWRAAESGETLPPPLDTYLDQVRELNPDGELRHYPGSPWLVWQMLRDADRLRLFELHSSEIKVLSSNFRNAGRKVTLYDGDGFAGIKTVPPPPPRRTLVLINPSFEDRQDYARTVRLLQDSLQHFAAGVYAVWYPLVQRREAAQFPSRLKQLHPKDWLHVTLTIRYPVKGGLGLHSSGMFIVNPPQTLKAQLQEAMPTLVRLLGQDDGAEFMLEGESS